jgi:hypothetical protein
MLLLMMFFKFTPANKCKGAALVYPELAAAVDVDCCCSLVT